jgi:dynein heavy chain 1, cytosolic
MEARFDDFVANVVMATFQGGDEADKAIWTMLKSSEEWRSLSQKFLNEQLPSLMIAQKTTITGEDDGEGKEDDTKETSTDSMSFHAVGDVSWSPNPAIAFVKRSTGALSDASFASQIQIITLGSSTSSSQNKESSTAETTKTSSTDMLNLLLQFTQHTFAPLVRSTTTRDQQGVNAYAELKKKIAELELALTQCKQNLDVPIVNLEFDAHITKVSQKCYDSDKKLSLEQLLLSEKCEDTQFLNMLQMSVSRWTKEIRKVTALTDRRGEIDSALREVKFWHSLEKSLNNIETQKSSYEFQITFDVLRQGKRYRPVMAFEGDTGLTKANALVENVMLLMRDFPIDDLLAATDVTQIKRAVEKIFRHLSRLKKANMYVLCVCVCVFITASLISLTHSLHSLTHTNNNQVRIRKSIRTCLSIVSRLSKKMHQPSEAAACCDFTV